MIHQICAVRVAQKLRLRELRDVAGKEPLEFSNTELVVSLGYESYVFVYNYGSVVFFNVDSRDQERVLRALADRIGLGDFPRTSDVFLLEVQPDASFGNKVYFDRILCSALSYEKIKIACMLVGESVALEFYENLVQGLLERANAYSRRLQARGKLLTSGAELIRFIGMCLSTKQEIISNLSIVDSPEETWESPELDRLFGELKNMLDIDVRYRALEYKIRIVQESLEIFVELIKSRRETALELVVILLIVFEIVLSLSHLA